MTDSISGHHVADMEFEATCGLCGSSYACEGMPSEGSLRAGTFCPACKAERRIAPGILHWEVVINGEIVRQRHV